MGKSKHPGYKKMKDTPYITSARQISDAGSRGILDNYNSVNVFDDATKRSLDDYNNQIYQRAFNDMNRNYNNIMNAYASRNYNRFGSLNNTPASLTTDNYQRQFQRQMDDASYNKAINYENLINNELQRRYNTLNMFSNMYNYGQQAYAHDKMNWNVDNKNRDVQYANNLIGDQQLSNTLNGALSGAAQGFITTGSPWGALAGGAGGAIGGMM